MFFFRHSQLFFIQNNSRGFRNDSYFDSFLFFIKKENQNDSNFNQQFFKRLKSENHKETFLWFSMHEKRGFSAFFLRNSIYSKQPVLFRLNSKTNLMCIHKCIVWEHRTDRYNCEGDEDFHRHFALKITEQLYDFSEYAWISEKDYIRNIQLQDKKIRESIGFWSDDFSQKPPMTPQKNKAESEPRPFASTPRPSFWVLHSSTLRSFSLDR